MKDKNVVLRSYNLEGETRCVDIFRRPDGSFGFELFRREPEDARGWFAIGGFTARTFASMAEAIADAKAAVPWLTAAIERG